jgi:hypothetical protein
LPQRFREGMPVMFHVGFKFKRNFIQPMATQWFACFIEYSSIGLIRIWGITRPGWAESGERRAESGVRSAESGVRSFENQLHADGGMAAALDGMAFGSARWGSGVLTAASVSGAGVLSSGPANQLVRFYLP